MSNTISYSILKFTPSRFTGEVLNIGILFVFSKEEIVTFYAPEKLARLTKTYPGISEKLIRNYLKGFAKKTKELPSKLKLYEFDLNDLVTDNLIPEDASSLQFEKFRHAVFYGTIEEAKQQYIDLLLGAYQTETDKPIHKISDKELITKCKQLIIRKSPSIEPYLRSDDTRILKYNRVTFKSDFYWQNGTTNFVKGISLDLSSEENIIEKSLLINGQLRQIENLSILKDARIDLILQRPSSSLFAGAFEEAIDIIGQTDLDKELIVEKDIEDYANKVVEELKREN